jgi:hypothetical protein
MKFHFVYELSFSSVARSRKEIPGATHPHAFRSRLIIILNEIRVKSVTGFPPTLTFNYLFPGDPKHNKSNLYLEQAFSSHNSPQV